MNQNPTDSCNDGPVATASQNHYDVGRDVDKKKVLMVESGVPRPTPLIFDGVEMNEFHLTSNKHWK